MNKRMKSAAPGPPVNHLAKPPQVTATAQSVPMPNSPRQYANVSPGLPYPQQQTPNRGKFRPVDVYNPTTGSKFMIVIYWEV